MPETTVFLMSDHYETFELIIDGAYVISLDEIDDVDYDAILREVA